MAWYKNNGRIAYFWKSFRVDGQRKTVYFGRGLIGQLAAEIDAQHRARRQAVQEANRQWQDRLDQAERAAADHARQVTTVLEATLLAAGYYRPTRHGWRPHALRQRARKCPRTAPQPHCAGEGG